MVSREDIVAIVRYVSGLHDWVASATACLEARKPVAFYPALNKFIAGGR